MLSTDVLVIAFEATTGAHVWDATYDSGSSDYPNDAAFAPDGATVYAGAQGGGDFVTVAFSTT